MSNTRKIKKGNIRFADYKYQGEKAVATYAQDIAPVLAQCKEDRDNTPGKFDRYDLDMGFKFASIPKIEWLRIQQLGIQDDPAAIIKHLQRVKELEGRDYFTTTKRLG